MSEPTKREVLDIADHVSCNGEELWSEVSKLLERQDAYSRADQMKVVRKVWDA